MRLLTLLVIAIAAAAAAAADDVRPIPLVLYPAAAPSPALKYPLLPELRDTIPGNAVDPLPAGRQEHEIGPAAGEGVAGTARQMDGRSR